MVSFFSLTKTRGPFLSFPKKVELGEALLYDKGHFPMFSKG